MERLLKERNAIYLLSLLSQTPSPEERGFGTVISC